MEIVGISSLYPEQISCSTDLSKKIASFVRFKKNSLKITNYMLM